MHLAYAASDDGIGCLRELLRPERHHAPVLAGFEAIDRGRRRLRRIFDEARNYASNPCVLPLPRGQAATPTWPT